MGRAQTTITRAVEAWHWIQNNAHHEVGTEYHNTKVDSDGFPLKTHMYFANHLERIRVPVALLPEVWAGLISNKRKFDTRMYVLRANARRAIGEL